MFYITGPRVNALVVFVIENLSLHMGPNTYYGASFRLAPGLNCEH